MKIILVTRDYPPKIGGIATYAYHLTSQLKEMGARVKLVIGGNDTITLWKASRLEVAHNEVLHIVSAPYGAFAPEKHLVVTVHGPILDELPYYPFSRKFKAGLARHLERRALRKAKRIIAVSQYVSDRLRALEIDLSRIVIIKHGVDPRLFVVGEKSQTGKIRVLISARLEPRKNIREAIVALAEIDKSQYELVITGEGPEKHTLRALAHKLSIPAWFAGALDRDELLEQFKMAHIFVSTSRSEAFGLSVLEAMASSCAVVASNIPGHQELIEDGATGLLYNGHEQLADNIRRLIENPSLRDSLGGNASRKASAFSWDQAAAETLRIYEGVL